MEAELSHQLHLTITNVEGLHTSSNETPNEKLMRNKVLLVEEMYLENLETMYSKHQCCFHCNY